MIEWGEVGILSSIQDYDPSYGTTFLTFATYRIETELRNFLHSIRMAYMENYYPDDEDGEGDWAGEEQCFLACQELRPLEKMFLSERRDLLLYASKAIGISNFHDHKLEHLLAECEIKPHVIQLEEHPYFSDTKTLNMLAPYGVKLMAWYPLGHSDKGLLNEPVFADLAAKYGKTTAQIILRWHTQNGTSVIPGSTNPDHIRENADIFDFTLTDSEMAAIKVLNTNTRFYNPPADMEEKYAFFAIDLDSQP